MLNGTQQPQPQTNPKHMLMAVVGMSALFAGAIMMVAAVTTGEPPFPEGPPPPAPAKVHMLPEEWLPKIKDADQAHRSDASYLYTVNYHPDDWENLDGHLKHNIGPALGWHFTKVGAKTRVVLPKEDLPLLDRLAESPRAFVAENAWTNPRTTRPNELVNAEIQWERIPGEHTGLRLLTAILGLVTAGAGIALVSTAMQKDEESRKSAANQGAAGP